MVNNHNQALAHNPWSLKPKCSSAGGVLVQEIWFQVAIPVSHQFLKLYFIICHLKKLWQCLPRIWLFWLQSRIYVIFCVYLELGHSRTVAMSIEFWNLCSSPGNNIYNNHWLSRIRLHKHQWGFLKFFLNDKL